MRDRRISTRSFPTRLLLLPFHHRHHLSPAMASSSRLRLLTTTSSRCMSTLPTAQQQQIRPRPSPPPPSQLVLLTSSPPTLTPADVFQLLPEFSRRIHSVRILRAANLTPRCSALVSFDAGPGTDGLRKKVNFRKSTSDRARDWAARVTGRSLGGSILSAKLVSCAHTVHRSSLMHSRRSQRNRLAHCTPTPSCLACSTSRQVDLYSCTAFHCK